MTNGAHDNLKRSSIVLALIALVLLAGAVGYWLPQFLGAVGCYMQLAYNPNCITIAAEGQGQSTTGGLIMWWSLAVTYSAVGIARDAEQMYRSSKLSVIPYELRSASMAGLIWSHSIYHGSRLALLMLAPFCTAILVNALVMQFSLAGSIDGLTEFANRVEPVLVIYAVVVALSIVWGLHRKRQLIYLF